MKLFVAGAVAVAEAVVAAVLVATSNHEPHQIAAGALEIPAGIAFVAAGLIAIKRRPDNRTGLYLAAVGYLWFLGALFEANDPAVYAAGFITQNYTYVPFAALVLAFPTGRPKPRPDLLLVWASAVFVVFFPPLGLLFARRPPGCRSNCLDSPIVVYRSHTIDAVVQAAGSAIAVALIALVAAVLVRRWRGATAARRRILGPVYATSFAALVFLLLGNLVSTFSKEWSSVLSPFFLVLFTTVPFAYLFGILRSRLARGPVAGLVLAIGEGAPLRDAIADALNDPSVELAYWIDSRQHFVDRQGRFFEPSPTATLVERDGRRVGALVHDESLHTEPELVESVAAAAALALDNERLQTELRVQYNLLTTIVDTAPSLLVRVDTAGCIVNLNAATVRASGYDNEEEVRGRYFWDVFIGPHERDAVIGRFDDAAPEFPPSEYENVFTNRRGEELVIAWRSAPLRDDSGKVVGIVAGGLDVTERKRHEEEVRASRSRLVAAADQERRRLERNLHDGAQQRLVSLALALRLAQAKFATDPQAAAKLLARAGEELALALEELRELARGIHPAVLTDRGLTAALEALASRSPLAVELTPLDRTLPEPIEAAAYYVVSESLANVVKHADATAVEVRLRAGNGSLLVEVEDDGRGGADPAAGSGLRGLADRLAALDGELRLEQPAGGGTRVVAAIPLAP